MIEISPVLIFACAFYFVASKTMFDLDSDYTLKSLLGNIEKLQKDLPRQKLVVEDIDVALAKYAKELPFAAFGATTETTENPKEKYFTELPLLNLTHEDLEIKRKKLEVIRILKNKRLTAIPDFANGDDDPTIITRRFDSMRKIKEKHMEGKQALREVYFDYEPEHINRIRTDKRRLLNLMAHFVYTTRYRLVHMQKLRFKYRFHIKYKIGYCFAVLRNIRNEQLLIYENILHQYDTYSTLMIHLKFYEQVLRLDRDIKDLVFYILKLNYDMKLLFDPEYYDDSVQPTQLKTTKDEPLYPL